MKPAMPIVYYSPPLPEADAAERWSFETIVLGADGHAGLLPGQGRWTAAEGRKACARHVLDQMRADRAAAHERGAAVAIVAVLDAASWADLRRGLGL